MRLADHIGDVPVLILVCATAKGPGAAASVIPSVQNLLLAARALGVGGTITTLHAQVEERVYCTCRCNSGNTGFAECECPDGFSCVNVLEQGGPGVRGGYCVRNTSVSQ